MINLIEQMGKKILKLSTLKSSFLLNIQQLREEQDKVLNSDKDNGKTETVEELDKLRQILEDRKCDVIKIGE